MQLRNTLFFFILVILLSCNNNPTNPAPPIAVKDSSVVKKDSTTNTDSLTSNANNYGVSDYGDAGRYVDSIFNLNKGLATYTEESFAESAQGNDAPINKVILIGNLFTPTIKHAILIYRTNDSTLNCRIFEDKQNTWIKDLDINIPSLTSEEDTLVTITDINGDKIPDLLIAKEYSAHAIRIDEINDAWLFNGSAFTKVEGFDKINNASYDSTVNEVYSYLSMGCGDLSKYFGEYKIVNSKAVLLKEVSCDCCPDAGDSNSCRIIINKAKPITVKQSEAYQYAPGFYKDLYKQELTR
jgi:hypothetical protein